MTTWPGGKMHSHLITWRSCQELAGRLADGPAALGLMGRAGGAKWRGADNHALSELVGALGRPAGHHRHHFVVAWSDQLGVGGMLLSRDALFGDEQPLLNGVKELLAAAV